MNHSLVKRIIKEILIATDKQNVKKIIKNKNKETTDKIRHKSYFHRASLVLSEDHQHSVKIL